MNKNQQCVSYDKQDLDAKINGIKKFMRTSVEFANMSKKERDVMRADVAEMERQSASLAG